MVDSVSQYGYLSSVSESVRECLSFPGYHFNADVELVKQSNNVRITVFQRFWFLILYNNDVLDQPVLLA